jgi:hypothetical protein
MGLLDQVEGGGVNFADVEAPSFELAPKGWYHCVISDTEMRETSSTSKKYPNVPMLNVEFTVSDGPYENRKFWRNYILHANLMGFFKQLLLSVGYEEAEIDDEDFDLDEEDLHDRQIDVKVRIRKATDQYDASNDVQQVAPYDPERKVVSEEAKEAKAKGGGFAL